MWFILWIALSVFVIGFYIWSLRVLYQQKYAWSVFAKKKGFEYDRGKITDPPTISGEVDGVNLSFYTGERTTEDVRGQRFFTVLEFHVDCKMPTGGVICHKDFRSIIDGLSFNQPYNEKTKVWKKGQYIARSRNAALLEDYLTEDRIQIIGKLFKQKDVSILYIFDEVEAVLRLETADPLVKPSTLDKYTKNMVFAMKKLMLTAEEQERYKPVLQKMDIELPARQGAAQDTVQINKAKDGASDDKVDITLNDPDDAADKGAQDEKKTDETASGQDTSENDTEKDKADKNKTEKDRSGKDGDGNNTSEDASKKDT